MSGSTVVCFPQLARFQSDSSQLDESFTGGFVLGDEHSSERAAFRAMIQPQQTYVLDRGYMEYQLVQDVDDRAAWLVVRAYNNIDVETIEELPVIVPDALHGHWTSIRDRIVRPTDPEFAHISFRLVETPMRDLSITCSSG